MVRLLPVLLLAASAVAQDAVQDFKTNCSSCHTIGGGRLTGPDLKNVESGRSGTGSHGSSMDPPAVAQGGDPYALRLFEEARNVQMPAVAGMTRARAEALLDLIAAESLLEKSQFMGLQLSDRPFTPADVQRGRDIFLGRVALMNGACVAILGKRGSGRGSRGRRWGVGVARPAGVVCAEASAVRSNPCRSAEE